MKRRALMVIVSVGAIAGGLWLMRTFVNVPPKGMYESFMGDQVPLRARRMDIQAICFKQPSYNKAWTAGHSNPNLAAEIMIKCMSNQGYEFARAAKSCVQRNPNATQWINWPSSIDAECYRSKDPQTHKKEDAEPLGDGVFLVAAP